MITFAKKPLPWVLVNNPILFRILSDTNDAIHYQISIDNWQGTTDYLAFEGILIPVANGTQFECTVNIAEILKAHQLPASIDNPELTVSKVNNFNTGFSVYFYRDNSENLTFNGKFYQGGVGKQMLRMLNENNTDIFAWKLHNTDRQFFMTTRTNERHIYIKRNELAPFFFIASSLKYRIIMQPSQNFFDFPPLIPGEVYALNLELVMQHYDSPSMPATFLEMREYLDSQGTTTKFVFDLTISEPARTPNRYIIKFLNSFAAFEKIEVTGKAKAEPEFADNNAFMVYDPEIDDYIEKNSRPSLREVIKADFGYKTVDEFYFIRDMLQSDLRYLIDTDGIEHEVRILADSFSHDIHPTVPGSVPLKIRFVESDTNYSPRIDIRDMPEETFETDIEFEVTIDSGNLNIPVTLLTLNGDESKTYIIDYGDGTVEQKNFMAPVIISSGEPGSDYYYEYEDSPLITHTYQSAGIFRVTVSSTANISNLKFTVMKSLGATEWVLAPVPQNHITKIIRIKSTSITSLNFSLAGLTNCIPDPDFVLETPLVSDMFATFHSFGRDRNPADPDYWIFNPGLLTHITKSTVLNNTFRECRMKEIPAGFFDSQVNVVDLFETFKRSKLGVRYYQGWTHDQFLQRNLDGTSFIPMNLLHNMPGLWRARAAFNAMDITGKDFGTLSEGFGNWHALCLLIKSEFFWNGKNRGNAAGTIQDISYCFGKMNQVAVEKDLFRYVRNSLTNISAVFYQTNWPRSRSVSQVVLLYPGGLSNDWIAMTTMNLQEMLGSQPFPNVKLALNAFCAAAGSWYGFNGTFNGDIVIAPDSIPIDNTICPRFPNIQRTSDNWDTWNFQTGLDGMLWYLRVDTAITPNADLVQATATNPIQY